MEAHAEQLEDGGCLNRAEPGDGGPESPMCPRCIADAARQLSRFESAPFGQPREEKRRTQHRVAGARAGEGRPRLCWNVASRAKMALGISGLQAWGATHRKLAPSTTHPDAAPIRLDSWSCFGRPFSGDRGWLSESRIRNHVLPALQPSLLVLILLFQGKGWLQMKIQIPGLRECKLRWGSEH